MTEIYDNQVLKIVSSAVPLSSSELRPHSQLKTYNEPLDIYIIEYYDIVNQKFIWEYFNLGRLLETYILSYEELDDMIMFCDLHVTNESILYKK